MDRPGKSGSRRHRYRVPSHWRVLQEPTRQEKRAVRGLAGIWLAALLYVATWFACRGPGPGLQMIDHELADPARIGLTR
jgi:hypothetical protein